MSSTGNVFPSVGENVDRAGLTAWTSPGSVTADDAVDATCNGAGSDYLVARSFSWLGGAGLPASAVILGVTARTEASEHTAGTEVVSIQLQDDTATLIGTAKTFTASGTAKAIYTSGSTSDLWGIGGGSINSHNSKQCQLWYKSLVYYKS